MQSLDMLRDEGKAEIAHNDKIRRLILDCQNPAYVKMTAEHMHREDYVQDLIKRLKASGESGMANVLNASYLRTKSIFDKFSGQAFLETRNTELG